MITISQLSENGYVAVQERREICKINKTDDKWVIRGGQLSGLLHVSAMAAFATLGEHYNDSYTVKGTDPEPLDDREILISRLCSSIRHLSLSQQVIMFTSNMTNGELTNLINQLQ